MDNSEVNFSGAVQPTSPLENAANSLPKEERKTISSKKRSKLPLIIILIVILLAAAAFAVYYFFLSPKEHNSQDYTVEEQKALSAFDDDISNFLFGEEKNKEAWEIEDELLDFINKNQEANPSIANSVKSRLASFYAYTQGTGTAINYLEANITEQNSPEDNYILLSLLANYYNKENNYLQEKTTIEKILDLNINNLKNENWNDVKKRYELRKDDIEHEE